MRNITYRPWDNRFMARKMINGETITIYAKTLKEARENLRLALKGIRPQKQKATSMTFENLWDKWFAEEKTPILKERSLEDIASLKTGLSPILGVQLNKLNKDKLREYLLKLPPTRTREKIYIYVRACLQWAVDNEILSKSPFVTIKAPLRKHEHKPPFTYEEQVRILEALKGTSLYPVIIVYLCTGMRKLEFDFLNIEKHIDRDELVLKAENLKGRGQGTRRFKNIQLSKELCDFIFEHLDEIHAWGPERAYKQFAKVLKGLNIKGSIVTCRHTYATNNFYLGNPELFISRQMGHKSSQITKDNYTDIDLHLSREKILKLYNNLYLIF